MTAGIWTERIRVRSYDVTPQGTASVRALTNYFQDAAGHHAAELGVSMQDLLSEGRAWVLARLHLEIDRLPSWDEDVVLETWPSGLDGLFATREVVFRRSDDDSAVARGTSAWLVIDTERRRPQRPPPMLYDLDTPDRPSPLEGPVDELSRPERVDRTRAFHVQYHDLDLNRHVTNGQYLEWALETVPTPVLDERRCTGVALQFEAEAGLGDPVHATAQLEEADQTLRVHHRLAHGETDETLALAGTTWT